MTWLAIAILAALGGVAVGYSVATILWGSRRSDDEMSRLAPAPIDVLEIAIDRAGDGHRVWVNGPAGNIARWYRVGRVTVDDRRLPRVV